MIVAGCDVGSLTAKAVALKDGAILGSEVIRSRPDPVLSATQVMDRLLEKLGLGYGDIDSCVATGYGRNLVPFAQANLSEISCHGRGAVWLAPTVRTVIDGGGQDYKILVVDGSGLLKRFHTTGKCAAGTGRALELMAESLGVDVSELGPLSLRSTKPALLNRTCPVINEIEIKRLVVNGVAAEDIAAGIAVSVAEFVIKLFDRFDVEKDITATGGIAKNTGVVKKLKEMVGADFVELPEDPQLIGAIGAAVFAADQLAGGC